MLWAQPVAAPSRHSKAACNCLQSSMLYHPNEDAAMLTTQKTLKFWLLSLVCAAAVAAIATYDTAKQRYINRDAPVSASDTISTLSCILLNTGAHLEATSTHPNPDPYLAYVDVESCRAGTSSSSESVPAYSKYWVQPSYDTEQNHLLIKAWDMGTRAGYINAVVRAGLDISPPYGDWTVDWCVDRLPTEAQYATDPCAKKGHITITADQAYELFYRVSSSGSLTAFDKQSKGVISQDGKSGSGKYFERSFDNDNTIREGQFAFIDGALLDYINGQESCKDPRESSRLKRSVWEAWLYDETTRQPIEFNAGFPVRKVATGQSGWAGFEGVRLDGNSKAEQSGEFVRLDASAERYTAFGSYGKLIKHTNEHLPQGLQAIDQILLRTRLNINTFASTLFADGHGSLADEYVIFYWDHASSKFVFVGRDKSSTGVVGKEFIFYETPYTFDISQLLTVLRQGVNPDNTQRVWERTLWGYQMGSNNQYVIQLANQIPGSSSFPIRAVSDVIVTRQVQTQVVPGSEGAPSELVCIGRCPRPVDGQATLQLESRYDIAKDGPEAVERYTFSSVDGSLKISGKPLRYSATDDYIDRSTNQVDTTRTDLWLDAFVTPEQLPKLTCWGNTRYCAYDTTAFESAADDATETFGTRGLDVFYVWQTGNERWQKFSGLKSQTTGQVVTFNEPKNLLYVAPNDPDNFGNYAGRQVSLRYQGSGRLWLPGHCENLADAQATTSLACDQTNETYIHDFAIPSVDNATGKVKDLDIPGREYLVKWIRQGIYYPLHQNANACQDDTLRQSFSQAQIQTLPTAEVWQNPRDSMRATMPAESVRDNQPKYIGGALNPGL